MVSEVEKVANCTPYLRCFQVQMYLFYIPKLNNAIDMLGIPSLHMLCYLYLRNKPWKREWVY
jgi:hypothetical protein